MTMVTLEFEVDTELWEAFCKICEENGVTPEEAIVRFFEEDGGAAGSAVRSLAGGFGSQSETQGAYRRKEKAPRG